MVNFGAFRANKYVLNQIFFFDQPPESKIRFTKTQVDEFWLFVDKFAQRCTKNGGDTSEELQSKYSALAAKLSDSIPEHWKDLDRLQELVLHRCRGQNDRHRCQDRIDVQTFRILVLMFLDFSQKRRQKKLAELSRFRENLPIYEYKSSILEQIKSYSVVLVAGDTGCGKSTQVPQYLLRDGFERIACTQPRRIACIALCQRLAHETVDEYGSEIGYQIRFERSKTKYTKILFLTEGLLLRQMIEDPLLSRYEVIILDEIHERHLSSDFLLGAIKCLLHKRKQDLKVVLMSATVNCELFSRYFGQCLVIKVPGRLYPIQTEYFPIEKISVFRSTSTKVNPDPYLKILQLIDQRYPQSERGDVLVFLSGFSEIEAVGEKLKTYAEQNRRWIILYLHSALPITEQDKVFDIAPDGVRKCILSTNIAETSITIDGIRFVIDSGKVKEMYYDSKLRMHRLQEIWISKASAEQRKGRAGRTGPGVCYRLYSQADFDGFDDFSKPEIQRVSLESLILNMISMGLNDVRKFPFIQAPDVHQMENSLRCLIDYRAVDEKEQITYLGRILSKLPVDIAIGKMLILSMGVDMFQYALSAAASLSVQSITTIRSKNNREMLDERQSLTSADGDLFTTLNCYRQWLVLKGQPDCSTRDWCRRLGFEEQRFHEITKLRRQFEEILSDASLVDQRQEERPSREALGRAERIARHGERKLYRRLKEQAGNRVKRRKMLNVNQDQGEQPDDEHHDDLDWNLKELEFNLFFDAHYFSDIERRHSLPRDDLDMMKMIMMMSFYPQLAIADQDNSYHSGSEQIFHTKDKPFVTLHPSTIYYTQPEVLRCSDTIESSPLGPLSENHTLLGYVSFIETNKSYICNCYKVPALYGLLLSAREVDTNEECTRIVFDNWIDIRFEDGNDAQQLLIDAWEIRNRFDRFMEILFRNLNSKEQEEETKNLEDDLRHTREKLKREMKIFLKSRTKYSIKRLLAADLKTIYTGLSVTEDSLKRTNRLVKHLVDRKDSKPLLSSSKGGTCFGFINYNCLKAEEEMRTVDNRRMFRCEHCQQEMYVSPIEQIRHEESCHKEKPKATTSKTATGSDKTQKFFCQECRQELWLHPIEILRHRKVCRPNKEDDRQQ